MHLHFLLIITSRNSVITATAADAMRLRPYVPLHNAWQQLCGNVC